VAFDPDWRSQLVARETRALTAAVRQWSREAAGQTAALVAASLAAAVAGAGAAPPSRSRRRR
jgi:hypothetical protein